MKRAAVLIGVDKTGTLPVLRDAAKGARRMESWARGQGFDSVEVFADDGGKSVEIGTIKKHILGLVDAGTFDQLVIYFAGHGVNIRYGEYWLLTDAPRDAQAAVNVRGSADLASYCGIPYVAMISDACRTAAQGIQAQFVSGSEIFPNDPPSGLEQPVDRFFACALGRPSYEVQDPLVTASEFQALYTDTALPVLTGAKREIWERVGATPTMLLRPRRFKDYLTKEVSRKISGLKLKTAIIQVPDAHISSDADAWLARLESLGTTAPPAPPPPPPSSAPPAPGPAGLLASLLSAPYSFEAITRFGGGLTAYVAEPFGPGHHETECGFKIRGARFKEVYSKGARATIVSAAHDDIRVDTPTLPGASVMLSLEGGRAVVLPAIPGFLGALTVEEGELVDVAYEPSDNSSRWPAYRERADELRALRALASEATRNGVFRLEGEDALAIAKRMQYAKGLDPALAIYAAYGYDGMGARARIRDMSGFMRRDLKGRFFDIALLAKELEGTISGSDPAVFSFAPLLAQGWALLSANRVALPPELNGLERSLAPSVWTMFDEEGGGRIREALEKGVVL